MVKNCLIVLDKMLVIESTGTISLRDLGKRTASFPFKVRDLGLKVEAYGPRLIERGKNRDSYLIAKVHGGWVIDSIFVDVLYGELNKRLDLFYPEVQEFLRQLNLNPTHLLNSGFSGFMPSGKILKDALGFEINPSKERCDEAEEFARELKRTTAEIKRIAYAPCFSNGADYERRFCYEVS